MLPTENSRWLAQAFTERKIQEAERPGIVAESEDAPSRCCRAVSSTAQQEGPPRWVDNHPWT